MLVLTAGMRAGATLTALDSGAAGVILKHSGTRQLLEAINRVAQGETWWDTALLRAALTDAKDKTDILAKARELNSASERERRSCAWPLRRLRGILCKPQGEHNAAPRTRQADSFHSPNHLSKSAALKFASTGFLNEGAN